MTKKEAFIKVIDYLFTDEHAMEAEEIFKEEFPLAVDFFEDLKNGKVKNSSAMTENGIKLLSWMQENVDKMSNVFTSKEAAEGLFTSGRSIAGTMRKLVTDGYVEKTGKDPVQYSLTEAGRAYQFDN